MKSLVEKLEQHYPGMSLEDLIYELQAFINCSILERNIKNAQIGLECLTEIALRGAAYV